MPVTPEQVLSWREALGGRRFLLAIGCSLVNTVLFGMGILSENGYLMIISGTVIAYITARTTQAVVTPEGK